MIPVAEPVIGKEEMRNVIEAVRSGWVSSRGKFIEQFERSFSAFCNMNHGVATSNGTVALHLALVALGIGAGDEVIVPSLTFIATANVVAYTGATPVLVDSAADYWGIDPDEIESKITNRTKAIIPVHLYGHPCDMSKIMRIARKHKLYVVEDCAEAHGAEYNGKKVGSFGIINCFSFYGNKIITTGEGGMCVTNNERLAARLRMLRDHGMNPQKKYWHDVIGFNYRMTNLQAAIGVAQVEKIRTFIQKKRQIAHKYNANLRDLAERGLIKLHPEMRWAKCVFWMYSILIEDHHGVSRDEMMNELKKAGIDSRPFFYPMHIMPCYKKKSKGFVVAEEVSRKGLNLPSGTQLSDTEIKYVCREIEKVFKKTEKR